MTSFHSSSGNRSELKLVHSENPFSDQVRSEKHIPGSEVVKSENAPAPLTPITTPITQVNSRVSPWLRPLIYFLGRWIVLPFYFGKIEVSGRENLPAKGSVILAPTHRSRWDAILVPYAAGRHVTGRDLRFMVSADEVKGFQGWFIRRLGGFPIDTRHPGISSLRHGIELLQAEEYVVIFPEGGIFRDRDVHPLKPGMARLALHAAASQPDLEIKIIPISVSYSQPFPGWGCNIKIEIGTPLVVRDYNQEAIKQSARQLTQDLETALQKLVERTNHSL